ncbi:hypothetical protein ACPA9J_17510 [Pseudomonas aeruginosa]
MIGTPAIRNLIREDKVARCIRRSRPAARWAVQTLDMCLKGLVARGPDQPRERPREGEDRKT